ncbi:template-activating factor I [Nematocida sp. LUAm3]|nr:template-activating factor I [Nematocida sp. LUAm3]KAI5175556.1 template-activating factor I [Nematocida sp. LUAm2]KAI5178414.1 template-activating factor I [Nematocida sp. LUAm1]
MNTEETLKELIELQNGLDDINLEALKKELLIKQKDFENIKEILEKRERYIREIPNFWQTVFSKTEYLYVLLGKEEVKEGEEECIPFEWIKSLKVDYRSGFRYWIEIEVEEGNEHIENRKLTKEFSVFEENNNNSVWTDILWREGRKPLPECALLRFISSEEDDDEDDLNLFQILSDIYVNAIYYYMRTDEPVNNECPNHGDNC